MVNKTTIVALRQQNLELEHYGVKGMKWGVRKQRPRSNRVRSPKQEKTPDQIAQAQARRKAALKKVAKGAAIIGGLAVGGVLVSQVARATGTADYAALGIAKARQEWNRKATANRHRVADFDAQLWQAAIKANTDDRIRDDLRKRGRMAFVESEKRRYEAAMQAFDTNVDEIMRKLRDGEMVYI